jgi:glycine/D-amino acid oxidase-like deaminating enzyme
MRVDVAIVGGGVMGAATAYWLTRLAPGTSVALIEADPTHARAATALSVASIRQQFTTAINVRISRFGIDFIRNFEAETDFAGGLALREQGYLFLARRPEAAALMAEVAQMQRAEGASTVVLGPAEIARRWPWMRCDDLSAASFGPRDEGWFDNMGLLRGFAEAAVRAGAVRIAGRVVRIAASGGTIGALTLADGTEISAGAVVLAAGSRTPAMLGALGVAIPVEPRKRTVFVVDAPAARHSEAPLIIDPSGIYLRPEGEMWITAIVPDDDKACDIDDFEPELHLFEDEIWPRLWARAEGFAATRVKRVWVGHYDYNTFDQNAIIGAVPGFRDLYLLNGFSGHGLQQSPAMGRGMAELILTGGWQSLDLSELSPLRLVEGRPVLERAVV